MNLDSIFKRFSETCALVIGDLMIDAYSWGKVNRISPEAPVPIVSITKKENRLGGAGNVALNLISLGAKTILCSVIGNDSVGQELLELLNSHNLDRDSVFLSQSRQTTIKERIISSGQHLLRVDTEDSHPLDTSEEIHLWNIIERQLNEQKVDVVVFEDYDKGCITPLIISKTVDLCLKKGIPTIVDPKKRNFLQYKNVTLFKPNLKELKEGLRLEELTEKTIELAKMGSEQLVSQFGIQKTLITLSENGVIVYDGKSHTHIKAHVREIADVSGAGDTVVSVAALCLAQNLDLVTIGSLSNLAGGLVCEHVGVVPIDKEELLSEAILMQADKKGQN
ncbi:MAG: bifunctional ADP-heptose synthase [Cytophagales bacterium]